MDQTQAEFVVKEIKKEIEEIKNKAENGDRITRDKHSDLGGQVFMLWRLNIVTMEEWEAMRRDISFSYCGVMRED